MPDTEFDLFLLIPGYILVPQVWVPSAITFYRDPEPSVSPLRHVDYGQVMDSTRFKVTDTGHEETFGNNFFSCVFS